jgi:hypothetical protein
MLVGAISLLVSFNASACIGFTLAQCIAKYGPESKKPKESLENLSGPRFSISLLFRPDRPSDKVKIGRLVPIVVRTPENDPPRHQGFRTAEITGSDIDDDGFCSNLCCRPASPEILPSRLLAT